MKICIAGDGVVGGTLKHWLGRNTDHRVTVYDPPKGHVRKTLSDVLFVSVPVPTESSELDLSILHSTLDDLQGYALAVFIRSTVLPGTCDALTKKYGRPIYAMPEFLRQRTHVQDFELQDVIVGAPEGYDPSEPHEILNLVFYGKKTIRQSSAKNCEMTKYAHNIFLALKVTYFNVIYDICRQHSISFEAVRSMITISGSISQSHTCVPGPDGQFGFGGSCFPKDLQAFLGFLDDDPVPATARGLLQEIVRLNSIYRPINSESNVAG